MAIESTVYKCVGAGEACPESPINCEEPRRTTRSHGGLRVATEGLRGATEDIIIDVHANIYRHARLCIGAHVNIIIWARVNILGRASI